MIIKSKGKKLLVISVLYTTNNIYAYVYNLYIPYLQLT